jgi:CheY-like chemotaxis protein
MILHAEDEASDALLLKVAFSRARFPTQIHNVTDGQEAIDYMAGAGPYTDRQKWPLPELLLLDLKMPCLSGFEVLSWVRAQEQFRTLPVVVLTSSHLTADSKLARQLGATAYLEKTPEFEDVVALVRTLLAAASAVAETTPLFAHTAGENKAVSAG